MERNRERDTQTDRQRDTQAERETDTEGEKKIKRGGLQFVQVGENTRLVKDRRKEERLNSFSEKKNRNC